MLRDDLCVCMRHRILTTLRNAFRARGCSASTPNVIMVFVSRSTRSTAATTATIPNAIHVQGTPLLYLALICVPVCQPVF
jgi:hypothetical protein